MTEGEFTLVEEHDEAVRLAVDRSLVKRGPPGAGERTPEAGRCHRELRVVRAEQQYHCRQRGRHANVLKALEPSNTSVRESLGQALNLTEQLSLPHPSMMPVWPCTRPGVGPVRASM